MVHLTPKLVAVKTSMHETPCHLVAVIVDRYDKDSEEVILREGVMIDGHQTAIVPAELCFEFSADVVNSVNALVNDAAALTEQADEKLTGAKILGELALERAFFELDTGERGN